MEYPEQCIRGIPDEKCLYEDSLLEGNPVARLTLYPFHKEHCRDNGWIPESINWMFDADAIDFTFNQKNAEEELQFKVGIAILSLIELNKLKRKHRSFFCYEKDPIKNCPYHGNLLLKAGIKKERKRMICDVLANNSEIKLREDYQSAETCT